MELLVFLFFLGFFQVKGMTFEPEKLDSMNARNLRVKPCLPTLSAEWWDEFFITPITEIIHVGPLYVCFTFYPEVENCWEETIDKIDDIMDKFGPHMESLWSSLQKFQPYLNGSFCNLQDSHYTTTGHTWYRYSECEKCKYASQDFLKNSFASDVTDIFTKVLRHDFCHYMNSNSTDFGESECNAYVEDIIPKVRNWFQGHIKSTDVCRDHWYFENKSCWVPIMLEEESQKSESYLQEKTRINQI